MANLPPITISTLDRDRLYALLEHHQEDQEVVEHLYDELDRAECRPLKEMPDDVVMLHRWAYFKNQDNGREHRLMLVMPDEVSEGPDRLSILSPVGAALLGLSVGASIDWPSKGKVLRLTLISVARGL